MPPVDIKDVEMALAQIEPDYSTLAKLGPDVLPFLEELLRSGDRRVAPRAVYAAAVLGEDSQDPATAKAVATVITEAANSQDPLVRVAAALANHVLPPEIGGPIAVHLLTDADIGVRKTTLEGIPGALTPELTDKLADVAQHDEDPTIRSMAATLLEKPV